MMHHNHKMRGKWTFRLLQRRGFWAVVSSLLALCLVVSGVLASSPVQGEPMSLRAAVVGIAVVPSSVSVYVNNTFTLEIWVYPNGQQIDAVDADLTFDPIYLEVLSITGDPSALPIELYSAFNNTNGTLTHSRGILEGTSPSSTLRLCSIRLKAKVASDEIALAFTDLTGAYSGGQPVETETTDATMVIAPIPAPVPVGGVARLPDPSRIAAPWMVRLAVLAGLILGAAVVFRKGHKVV